jgi:hypothetical protein
MDEKIDLFYFLKAMTVDKKNLDFSNEEIEKKYDVYMINRYVSMVECFIPLINELNKYNMSKQSHYNLLKNCLPNQKLYFKYIKKSKDLTLNEKKYIAYYYSVGLNEAELYIKHLSEEEINTILNVYKYGKNKFVDI